MMSTVSLAEILFLLSYCPVFEEQQGCSLPWESYNSLC